MNKEDTKLEERATGRIEAAPFLVIMMVIALPLYGLLGFFAPQSWINSGIGGYLFVAPIALSAIIAWPLWSKIKGNT